MTERKPGNGGQRATPTALPQDQAEREARLRALRELQQLTADGALDVGILSDKSTRRAKPAPAPSRRP
ncbi:type II toxin-antitoxin system VapB family antitoxin [Streptomyces albidoflavus]